MKQNVRRILAAACALTVAASSFSASIYADVLKKTLTAPKDATTAEVDEAEALVAAGQYTNTYATYSTYIYSWVLPYDDYLVLADYGKNEKAEAKETTIGFDFSANIVVTPAEGDAVTKEATLTAEFKVGTEAGTLKKTIKEIKEAALAALKATDEYKGAKSVEFAENPYFSDASVKSDDVTVSALTVLAPVTEKKEPAETIYSWWDGYVEIEKVSDELSQIVTDGYDLITSFTYTYNRNNYDANIAYVAEADAKIKLSAKIRKTDGNVEEREFELDLPKTGEKGAIVSYDYYDLVKGFKLAEVETIEEGYAKLSYNPKSVKLKKIDRAYKEGDYVSIYKDPDEKITKVTGFNFDNDTDFGYVKYPDNKYVITYSAAADAKVTLNLETFYLVTETVEGKEETSEKSEVLTTEITLPKTAEGEVAEYVLEKNTLIEIFGKDEKWKGADITGFDSSLSFATGAVDIKFIREITPEDGRVNNRYFVWGGNDAWNAQDQDALKKILADDEGTIDLAVSSKAKYELNAAANFEISYEYKGETYRRPVTVPLKDYAVEAGDTTVSVAIKDIPELLEKAEAKSTEKITTNFAKGLAIDKAEATAGELYYDLNNYKFTEDSDQKLATAVLAELEKMWEAVPDHDQFDPGDPPDPDSDVYENGKEDPEYIADLENYNKAKALWDAYVAAEYKSKDSFENDAENDNIVQGTSYKDGKDYYFFNYIDKAKANVLNAKAKEQAKADWEKEKDLEEDKKVLTRDYATEEDYINSWTVLKNYNEAALEARKAELTEEYTKEILKDIKITDVSMYLVFTTDEEVAAITDAQYVNTIKSTDYFKYDEKTKTWSALPELFKNDFNSIKITYNAQDEADSEYILNFKVNDQSLSYRVKGGVHNWFTIPIKDLFYDVGIEWGTEITTFEISVDKLGDKEVGEIRAIDVLFTNWDANFAVKDGVLTWDNIPLIKDKDAEKDSTYVTYDIYVTGYDSKKRRIGLGEEPILDDYTVKYTNDKQATADARTVEDASADLDLLLAFNAIKEKSWDNLGLLETYDITLVAYDADGNERGSATFKDYEDFLGARFDEEIKAPALKAEDLKITELKEDKDDKDKVTGYESSITFAKDKDAIGYVYYTTVKKDKNIITDYFLAEEDDKGNVTITPYVQDGTILRICAVDADGNFGRWSNIITIESKKDKDGNPVEGFETKLTEVKPVYIEKVEEDKEKGTKAYDVLHFDNIPYANYYRVWIEIDGEIESIYLNDGTFNIDGNEIKDYVLGDEKKSFSDYVTTNFSDLATGKYKIYITADYLNFVNNVLTIERKGNEVVIAETELDYTAPEAPKEATWNSGTRLDKNGNLLWDNVDAFENGKNYIVTVTPKDIDANGKLSFGHDDEEIETAYQLKDNGKDVVDDNNKQLKYYPLLEKFLRGAFYDEDLGRFTDIPAGKYTVTVTYEGEDKDGKPVDYKFDYEYEFKGLAESEELKAPEKIVIDTSDYDIVLPKDEKVAYYGVIINDGDEEFYPANTTSEYVYLNSDGEYVLSNYVYTHNIRVRAIDKNGASSAVADDVAFKGEISWKSDIAYKDSVLSWTNIKDSGKVKYEIRAYTANDSDGDTEHLEDGVEIDTVTVEADDKDEKTEIDLRFLLAEFYTKESEKWECLKDEDFTLVITPKDEEGYRYAYAEIDITDYAPAFEDLRSANGDISYIFYGTYEHNTYKDGVKYDESVFFNEVKGAIGYIVRFQKDKWTDYGWTIYTSTMFEDLDHATDDITVWAIFEDGSISCAYTYDETGAKFKKNDVKLNEAQTLVTWNKISDATAYYIEAVNGKGDVVLNDTVDAKKLSWKIPVNALNKYWFVFRVYAVTADGEKVLMGQTKDSYKISNYHEFDPAYDYDEKTGWLTIDSIPYVADFESEGGGHVASYAMTYIAYDANGEEIFDGVAEFGGFQSYAADEYDANWAQRLDIEGGTPKVNLAAEIAYNTVYWSAKKGESVVPAKIFVSVTATDFTTNADRNDLKEYYSAYDFELDIDDVKLDESIVISANGEATQIIDNNYKNKVAQPIKGSDNAIGYFWHVYNEEAGIDYWSGHTYELTDTAAVVTDYANSDKYPLTVDVYGFDVYGNYGKAYTYKVNAAGEAKEVETINDVWTSGAKYDEKTGILTWNVYEGADLYCVMIVDDKGNFVKSGIINGLPLPVNGGRDYEVVVNSDLIEKAYLMGEAGYGAIIGKELMKKGSTYDISVAAVKIEDYKVTNYVDENAIQLKFKGGRKDDSIIVPKATEAFSYEANGERNYRIAMPMEEGIAGYAFELVGTKDTIDGKVFGKVKSFDGTYEFKTDISRSAQTYTNIKVWAIDINGNYSEPVTVKLSKDIPEEYDFTYRVATMSGTGEASTITEIGTYENIKDALAQITDNSADYILTINDDVELSSLNIPATAKSVIINSDLGNSIKLTGTAMKFAADTMLLMDVDQTKDKTIKVSIASGKTLLVGKDQYETFNFNATSGNLAIAADVVASALKINDIEIYSDTAFKVANKAKAQIKGTLDGTITLDEGVKSLDVAKVGDGGITFVDGTKAKITVGDVTDSLKLKVVDTDGVVTRLAPGTDLIKAKKDVSEKTTIINASENGNALKAYYDGGVIKGNVAEAIMLFSGVEVIKDDTPYEAFTTLEEALSKINDETKKYIIILNEDVNIKNFTLPKKAAHLSFFGNGYVTINAEKVAKLKMSYPVDFVNTTLVNNKKNGKISIQVTTPKAVAEKQEYTYVSFEDAKFVADKGLEIKGDKTSTLQIFGECGDIAKISGFADIGLYSTMKSDNTVIDEFDNTHIRITKSFSTNGSLYVESDATFEVGAGAAVKMAELYYGDESVFALTKSNLKAITIDRIYIPSEGAKMLLTSDRRLNVGTKIFNSKEGRNYDELFDFTDITGTGTFTIADGTLAKK